MFKIFKVSFFLHPSPGFPLPALVHTNHAQSQPTARPDSRKHTRCNLIADMARRQRMGQARAERSRAEQTGQNGEETRIQTESRCQ